LGGMDRLTRADGPRFPCIFEWLNSQTRMLLFCVLGMYRYFPVSPQDLSNQRARGALCSLWVSNGRSVRRPKRTPFQPRPLWQILRYAIEAILSTPKEAYR